MDGSALSCYLISSTKKKKIKAMKLARELSLSCWMFVVTSGGTSWSAGCLGQVECLRKSVCSGTGYHELQVCAGMFVRDRNLELHPWSAVFAFCSMWMMPVLSRRFFSVSVGSCHLQRFRATRIYRTFITPYMQGPTTVQSTSQPPAECHWNQKPPP